MRIAKLGFMPLLLITIIMFFIVNESVWAEPPGESDKQKEDQEKRTKVVFLIIVDGLQDKVLNQSLAPNIKGLGSSGLKAEQVIPVFPGGSSSNIMSILTGVTPMQHQFTASSKDISIPTILKLMENKGIKTSLFDGTEKLTSAKEGVNHVCKGPFNGKDSLVVENVVNELEDSNTYFNVVILPQLKDVIEKHGVDSAEYRKQITNTDNQVGRLLHYLHQKGAYDESMVILTGTSKAPPLVMKGPELKVGTTLPPVSLTDIAPTICYLTGLKMKQAEGMVLYNAIKPKADRSETYLLAQRVDELSRAHAKDVEGMHRLEKEKMEVKQLQEKVTEEKQMIQQKISVRDDKIAVLSTKIAFMKMLGIALLIIFGFGYIIEYKILRKKFLMF